jgi:hypothetical protein
MDVLEVNLGLRLRASSRSFMRIASRNVYAWEWNVGSV